MIELLIVVAIIGIAATITWSNLAQSRNVKKVSNACDSVLALANKTRAYALAGQVGVNGVSLDCTTTSCSIKMTKTTGASDPPAPEDTLNVSSLQGVTMNPASNFSVVYTAPYGESSIDTSILFSLPGTAITPKKLVLRKFTAICQ